MNYKIIQDKNELLKFLDWLPDNTKEQKYYLSLMARKKYNKIMNPYKPPILIGDPDSKNEYSTVLAVLVAIIIGVCIIWNG